MAGKQDKETQNKCEWKNWLVEFYWLVFIIAFATVIFAAYNSFDRFLSVAVTALVFITGICWALRTTNVHQCEVAERNMQTNIYLYDDANDEMKRGYRLIIENYNDSANQYLNNAKIFSYITLYLSFSAVFLFMAEMFILIYYGCPHHWCLSQCHWAGCTSISFAILSGLFFIPAIVSFGIRLSGEGEDKYKCFRKFSACLANHTFLKEDWIFFYRGVRKPENRCEKELRNIILKEDNGWLWRLRGIDIDC